LPMSVRAGKRQISIAMAGYFVLLLVSFVLFVQQEVSVVAMRSISVVLVFVAAGALQFTSSLTADVPSVRALVARPALSGRLAVAIFAGTAGALAAAQVLALFLPMSDDVVLAQYQTEGHGLWSALLDYSLLAPLLEECMFRGVILGALIGPLGRRGSMWASSLMFATLHLTPITFVHHTLLGLVCAHARLESRSLLLPIVIHGVYNAIVVTLAWP